MAANGASTTLGEMHCWRHIIDRLGPGDTQHRSYITRGVLDEDTGRSKQFEELLSPREDRRSCIFVITGVAANGALATLVRCSVGDVSWMDLA